MALDGFIHVYGNGVGRGGGTDAGALVAVAPVQAEVEEVGHIAAGARQADLGMVLLEKLGNLRKMNEHNIN